MHFGIRFLTEYHYSTPVTDNLNALRVRPATTSTQRCDEFHTRIEPEARVSRHLDYFGTEVLEFGVPSAHEQLTIDVRELIRIAHDPTYSSRLVCADFRRSRHRRVTMVVANAFGERIFDRSAF